MSEHYNRLAIHYSACNEIYYKTQDCEKEFPIARAFGKCSEHFVNLRKCIQKQRRLQQAENYRKSKENQERLRKIFAEEKLSDLA